MGSTQSGFSQREIESTVRYNRPIPTFLCDNMNDKSLGVTISLEQNDVITVDEPILFTQRFDDICYRIYTATCCYEMDKSGRITRHPKRTPPQTTSRNQRYTEITCYFEPTTLKFQQRINEFLRANTNAIDFHKSLINYINRNSDNSVRLSLYQAKFQADKKFQQDAYDYGGYLACNGFFNR